MRRSEQINEIAAALAKAQGAIKFALKDSKNDHFKSQYADLASVYEACQKPLSDNGIAVAQSPSVEYGDTTTVTVTTLLMHASNQWLEASLSIRSDRPNAHGVGSAITYARRYLLAAMAGVAPDDDDDGNGAAGAGDKGQDSPPKQHPPRQQQQQKPPAKPDEPPPPDYRHMASTTLRDVCGCKTAEDALAVLKFVMGDEWDKLPSKCTPEEAKAICEGMTKCADERVPLAHVLEKAMEPN